MNSSTSLANCQYYRQPAAHTAGSMRFSSHQLVITFLLLGSMVAADYPEPSPLDISISALDLAEAIRKDPTCAPFIFSTVKKVNSQLRAAPTYLPNVHCMNLINADDGYVIEVTFEDDYEIEESENCKYDSLTFQDGPFVFSPVMLKLCGQGSRGLKLRSVTNYMRLTFTTDDAIEGRGFNLSYRYISVSDNITGEHNYQQCYFYLPFSGNDSIEVSDKSVRKFYTNPGPLENVDCVWDIHNIAGNEIWLWVEELVQPNLLDCSHREMDMYGVEHKLYEDVKSLTDTASSCYLIRDRFYPSASRVLFHVTSQSQDYMPMLRLNFTSYREPHSSSGGELCNDTWYSCEDGRLCLEMNLLCNSVYNCPDGDDESQSACDHINGHSFGLQFIFIGAAAMFFILVTVALIISAKRMIRENRELEDRRKSATVIINRRPSRLFQQSNLRKLLEPLQDTISHESVSQCSRRSHCPHSARNSMYSKRGSWFLNGSVSNLSITSTEPKIRTELITNPSPSVSPVAFLTPELYTNPVELKRLRATST